VSTQLNWSRNQYLPQDRLGGNFAGSLLLHAAIFGGIFAWAFITNRGLRWGEVGDTAGAVQATMVSAIPLPPHQPVNPDNVLTPEKPSPAPPETKEKTETAPDPKALAIPEKPTKPKIADKPVPSTPHPQPVQPQADKATSGDTTGTRIAMTSAQTRLGTISIGTSDPSFGVRYAYYVRQLTQKIASQWYTGMLDPGSQGHRVYIIFQVARDGTPSNVRIQTPSGDKTLDQTALRAVQHIDTFGPLPDGYSGNYINVVYYFDPPEQP
jgi:periplasmic protein TonB